VFYITTPFNVDGRPVN